MVVLLKITLLSLNFVCAIVGGVCSCGRSGTKNLDVIYFTFEVKTAPARFLTTLHDPPATILKLTTLILQHKNLVISYHFTRQAIIFRNHRGSAVSTTLLIDQILKSTK